MNTGLTAAVEYIHAGKQYVQWPATQQTSSYENFRVKSASSKTLLGIEGLVRLLYLTTGLHQQHYNVITLMKFNAPPAKRAFWFENEERDQIIWNYILEL